jgi:hypothetical protein
MTKKKTSKAVEVLDNETQDRNNRLFNWGLGDGKAAKERGGSPEWQRGEHFEPCYEDGYWIGRGGI